MALNLAGLRVAICGGLGGIGREICKGLLEKNVAVCHFSLFHRTLDILRKKFDRSPIPFRW